MRARPLQTVVENEEEDADGDIEYTCLAISRRSPHTVAQPLSLIKCVQIRMRSPNERPTRWPVHAAPPPSPLWRVAGPVHECGPRPLCPFASLTSFRPAHQTVSTHVQHTRRRPPHSAPARSTPFLPHTSQRTPHLPMPPPPSPCPPIMLPSRPRAPLWPAAWAPWPRPPTSKVPAVLRVSRRRTQRIGIGKE